MHCRADEHHHELIFHCSLSFQVHYNQMVLGKFCGQENATELSAKQPIVSPSNKMDLTFQTSDFSPELQKQTGFSANYKAIGTTYLFSSEVYNTLCYVPRFKRYSILDHDCHDASCVQTQMSVQKRTRKRDQGHSAPRSASTPLARTTVPATVVTNLMQTNVAVCVSTTYSKWMCLSMFHKTPGLSGIKH